MYNLQDVEGSRLQVSRLTDSRRGTRRQLLTNTNRERTAEGRRAGTSDPLWGLMLLEF